jgi:hypothetical protein
MPLLHVEGRVIVRIDLNVKEKHVFEGGLEIIYNRKFDCFDRKHTEATQGEVVSAEHIPQGATVLLHHNATHDVYKIFDYQKLGDEEAINDIFYYSIPENQCYLWRIEEGDNWHPTKGFETALRIFEPYKGLIQNIEPKLLKQKLFITSGEFKNKAVITERAADYEIVFQDNGKENKIIRLRGTESDRCEIIAVDHYTTEKIMNGELLVGIDLKEVTKKMLQYA